MIRKIIAVAICVIALSVYAQKVNLIHGWEFQRLSTIAGGEIKNQGSDWSSQYAVEHIASDGESLALSADTVRAEMATLAAGEWESVSLPHTPFVEELTVLHQWQGICYYRKQLDVKHSYEGKRLWLEFGGAMHVADVWVNGRYVTRHTGGYLPFVVDVTDILEPGGKNEVLVRLDNRNNPLVPPGKPLESLDFCYYGGLYRGVNLIVKPDLHISHPNMADKVAGGGVFVSYPSVADDRAEVAVKVDIANDGNADYDDVRLRSTLYEYATGKGKGRKVLSDVTAPVLVESGKSVESVQRLEVANPNLWSPDAPNLYVLETEVVRSGKTIDREETKIGIRHIEFTKDKGFLINGKPMELVGSNRHMEYPYVGNALSDNAQYRDIYQIRSNGFNIVRLGHYPQAPSVLDACDELGLLAIEPIPGWQFYNDNEIFVNHTYDDVRQMVRRDRNHPSIVMWETTLNESWPPSGWKDGAVSVAHEEYPGNQCYTSGDSYGYDGFDVCYNDWAEEFHRPNNTSKPGFIREYYDYEFGGHYSTTRIGRGDGHKALRTNAWNAQWSFNRYKSDYPSTAGSAVWSMYDYNRGCCDNICRSGVADIFRLPKYSMAFFRTQVSPGAYRPEGPMPYEVFIACAYDGNGAPDTLQVFGNVDEVELFRDGISLGRKVADSGENSDYVAVPDGGNCSNLSYPPFTFYGVDWSDGVLEAVGYKDGAPVARHEIKVPGEASGLDVTYFESGKAATADDLIIVYVTLVDEAGVPLTHVNDRAVELEVCQGGTIQGPNVFDVEAGTASFVVRTAKSAGQLKLRAKSGGIESEKKVKLKKA